MLALDTDIPRANESQRSASALDLQLHRSRSASTSQLFTLCNGYMTEEERSQGQRFVLRRRVFIFGNRVRRVRIGGCWGFRGARRGICWDRIRRVLVECGESGEGFGG
jgi:hypothetical protein